MKRIVYIVLLLTAAAFAADANDTSGNLVISVNQNPVGKWQSVDFVRNIEDFKPGQRATKINLFLKDIEFTPDGTTSAVWTWSGNLLHNPVDKTKEYFQIKEANYTAYLFFPWPDGQKLYYYVLKKVPASTAAAAQSENTDTFSISTNQNPVGKWQSVDFVENISDFKPGQKNWQGELSLKGVEFMPNGKTSGCWSWDKDLIYARDGRTKAKFEIRETAGSKYLFFPWLSGDVTKGGAKPFYYVLKKVPDTVSVSDKQTACTSRHSSCHPISPLEQVSEFNDVRWKDLSKLNLNGRDGLIATLTFNQKTVWPAPQKMPPGDKPEKILADAMNPGLGIRELHKEGITGKGVNVAIIDQPLYQDHPEFAGKIVAYYDTGCGTESSMHGPAVTSLLVGTNCGTAPDARVYYAAAPSWKGDAAYEADALRWIIAQSEKLPPSEKIRVVSVSAAPSSPQMRPKNNNMWAPACAAAEAAGIIVLDCTEDKNRGFIGVCWYNIKVPESVPQCTPGFPGKEPLFDTKHILAPASPRTTAEEYDEGNFSYQYHGRGGLSWAIPYVAGVLALGWQIQPQLTPQQMKDLLFQSAYTKEDGSKIINPKEFIRLVKKAKPSGKNLKG